MRYDPTMGRKAKTHFLVKRGIDEVLASDGQTPPRPMVITGNDYPGGRERRLAVQVHGQSAVSRITDQLVRIEQDADPLGFLIAVQRGDLIPVHIVTDDGELVTKYQQASVQDRIVIAKFMVNKLLPNLSITKHLVAQADPDAPAAPGSPGQPSFAAIVSAAASRRGARPITDVPATPVQDIEDGGTPDDDAAGEGDALPGVDRGDKLVG